MRYGIFDQIEATGEPLHALYRDRLEFARLADEAGFWCFHKSEHHMIPLDALPQIGLFFAAAAQQTERIRFGSLVYLLPFHHPIRLAEEVSTLDHMLEGRFELGVGRGISLPEHELWGLDATRMQENYDESLAVLLAALTTDTLTFHGEQYHFDDLPIIVRPYQQPHPPLWYPGNVATAARHDMSTLIGGPPPVVAGRVAQYRELQPAGGIGTCGAIATVYVAPTDDEARARVRSAWPVFSDRLTPLFRKWDLPPPNDPTLGGDVDLALQVNALVAGSPATVAAHLERLRDEAGIDYFVGKFTFGDITHREVMRSVSLFAEHVMTASTTIGG